MIVPVVLAHGLKGSPNGAKGTLVKKHFNAIVPSLGTLELPEQANALLHAMPDGKKSVLIGSSLGALASLGAADIKPEKVGYLILLAPAFDLDKHRHTFVEALTTRPGLMDDAPRFATLPLPPNIPCHVVQGMEDELFSIDRAIAFVHNSPLAALTLVHDNHQLEKSLPKIVNMIGNAVACLQGKGPGPGFL